MAFDLCVCVCDGVESIVMCPLLLTLSSSWRFVTMMMVGQSNSHTILQKSAKVEGMGPWVAI